MELERAIVIKYASGFYTLETGEGEIVARLRGRLKRGPRTGDILAVGDWVQISRQQDGSAMIEEIEERQRSLSRLAPTPRGEYEQVIIANPDQAVFVFACTQPEPRLRMLDRFLIISEEREIPSLIVANKVDLVGKEAAKSLFDRYADIGYDLIYTSVKELLGVEELHQRLKGQISVLAGPSGVGKSSLLNAIQPGLGLAVREISKTSRKGRHTTVVRQMFPLEGGGYVADTPGLKALALWDIEPEELDGYFPEISPLVADCQFSSCSHIHEPGCAVKLAVEEGRIHPERYDSYVRIRLADEE